MEAAQVPINRQVDKKAGMHIHNGIPLSYKKDKILPFATAWIDLVGITLSEINQTKTDIV